MRKPKYSDSQIVSILKEVDGGIPVAQILRTYAISTGTFYKWRPKYDDLEATELRRIKELELQLAEFKTLVADLTLEHKAMRGLIANML